MTDSTGNVVYSAAHEPYGGIQQTWVTSFDPELKFSGKPHDAESGLDYFGARYYDRAQYRFISVEQLIGRGIALEGAKELASTIPVASQGRREGTPGSWRRTLY